jgi:hypothetical protein
VVAEEEWAVRQDLTRVVGRRRNGNATRNLREEERSIARAMIAAGAELVEREIRARRNKKRDMHLPRAAPWEEMLKRELGAIPPTPENPANYR